MRVRVSIIILLAGLFFQGNAFSQHFLRSEYQRELRKIAGESSWRLFDENPVITGDPGSWDAGALGSMSVLIVNGTLHLYYESWGVRGEGWNHSDYASLQIGHATSVDGINWTKDAQNPVIPIGEKGDFDFQGTWDPFVLFEEGIYKMWYGGGVKPNEIGYATSIDGSRFTKQKQLSHNLNAVEDMHVVHDAQTGKYYMYFWHRAAKGGAVLLRAESRNETDYDFSKPESVLIEGEIYPGRYKFSHVFQEQDLWWMYYSNFTPATGCVDATVRCAVSDDGVNWKLIHNQLLDGMDAEIVKAGRELYLMYYAPQGYFDRSACDIRLAVYNGKLSDMETRTDPVAFSNDRLEIIFTELALKDLEKFTGQYDLSSKDQERVLPILKERSRCMHEIGRILQGEEQVAAMKKCIQEFEHEILECIGRK